MHQFLLFSMMFSLSDLCEAFSNNFFFFSSPAMEMSNMMGMGSLMSLGSMNGLNPFMLQQFLNQNGMHQNWSGGLSGNH